MKKAVIFDLDGTLLDTLEDLKNSTNAALAAHGMPERTLDEVRQFVGNGVRRLMKLSIPGGEENPEFEETFADFKVHYGAHCNDNTKPYAGVPELLRRLKEDGVRTAIVSNKLDSAVKELSRLYFDSEVEVAIGERQGVRRKPAPDTVFTALDELGIDQEDAVYVGDSEVDVATAAAAGIPLICVDWGFRSRETLVEAGAEVIVSDAEALYEALKSA